MVILTGTALALKLSDSLGLNHEIKTQNVITRNIFHMDKKILKSSFRILTKFINGINLVMRSN